MDLRSCSTRVPVFRLVLIRINVNGVLRPTTQNAAPKEVHEQKILCDNWIAREPFILIKRDLIIGSIIQRETLDKRSKFFGIRFLHYPRQRDDAEGTANAGITSQSGLGVGRTTSRDMCLYLYRLSYV